MGWRWRAMGLARISKRVNLFSFEERHVLPSVFFAGRASLLGPPEKDYRSFRADDPTCLTRPPSFANEPRSSSCILPSPLTSHKPPYSP